MADRLHYLSLEHFRHFGFPSLVEDDCLTFLERKSRTSAQRMGRRQGEFGISVLPCSRKQPARDRWGSFTKVFVADELPGLRRRMAVALFSQKSAASVITMLVRLDVAEFPSRNTDGLHYMPL